ncbi:MAG: hypothetical protein HQ464_00875 [Planctomycetes bacterium]|nr:hypothetical protein [Planctomycetota bacterium]
MDPTLLLLRWAHVLAAIVAMGGLVFARFALVPALSDFDAATREKIHDSIRRRWLPWVISAITVLLASGLVNFLLFNIRVKADGWGDRQWMRQNSYHAMFGAKFLLAMVAFYFASGLVGRGQGTQWIRNDRAKWLSVTLGLLLAVVLLSGWMRQLHTGPNLTQSQMNGLRDSGDNENGVGFGADAGVGEERNTRYQDGAAGSKFRGSKTDDSKTDDSEADASEKKVAEPEPATAE